MKLNLYDITILERQSHFMAMEIVNPKMEFCAVRSVKPKEPASKPVKKDPRTFIGWALKSFID